MAGFSSEMTSCLAPMVILRDALELAPLVQSHQRLQQHLLSVTGVELGPGAGSSCWTGVDGPANS